MILTNENIIKEHDLTIHHTLIFYKCKKEFELKIIDNFTGEYLIIDNDLMNKKPLKFLDYVVLCNDIKNQLLNGEKLNDLNIQ